MVVVMAYLKALSGHSPEENHERVSVRITGSLAEIWTG
jgi:hypothetical protein